MKKVLHLAEKADGGGAESVFRNTILALRNSRGFTHLVACRRSGNSTVTPHLDFGDPPRPGIRRVLSQTYSHRNFRLLKKFLKAERPDIIHVQNYGNLSPAVLRALWRYKRQRPGIKVFHTVHTFEYLCSHFAGFDYARQERCLDCAKSTFKFKIFYRGCSRGGYLHSVGKGIASLLAAVYIGKGLFDAWITPSDFLRDCMVQGGFAASRITTIRNPLSDWFLNNQPPPETYAGSASHCEIRVVYFGRLSAEKNLECLLRAFQRVLAERSSAILYLVGEGDEKEALVRLCCELGMAHAVVFQAFLPSEKLKDFLSNANLAILPSKCFENAPMMVCEAVSAGLFPIVAGHGGMKEMVEWLDYGKTFASENEEDLANTILQAAQEYPLLIQRLPVIQAKMREWLNFQVYTAKLIELYEK